MVDNPPAFNPSSGAQAAAVVLVLTPFEENAKRIESHLRNAGHKVRAEWISEISALEAHLQRSTPDVLITANNCADIPLRLVIDSCRRFAPSLPVLALAAELSGAVTAAAVASGARDLVADGSSESLAHLERVYVRETTQHRNTRELTRARSLLADYESRYTLLLEGTGDAVAHISEGILSQVNPAFAALLGYDDDAELAGMPMMDVVASDHQGAVRDHLKRLNKGAADGQALNCNLLRKDGDVTAVCAQLTRGEAEGEAFIEMLIRAESAQAVAGSPFSGRADFFKAIDVPTDTVSPRAAVLIIIDLLEDLEDRIGLLDSEIIVSKFTESLRHRLNASDQLFQLSTGEFSLYLNRSDALEFETLAKKIVTDIAAETFVSDEHEAQLTVSVSVYPIGESDTADKLVKELITETRKLSRSGGNKSQVLGVTAQSNAEEREDERKAEAVRAAIDEGRLKLAYQTIASLEGDTRQHFDVLVRMIDKAGAEHHASEFIRAAERGGLMRSLDRWVVARAFKVIETRQTRDDSPMLFLKLSEETLKDAEAFLAWFNELSKNRPLRDGEICFELQEVIAQNHIRKAKILTSSLRDSKASVAIEHFGIGNGSARMLEHLAVNFLKFHSTFTHNFDDKDIQKKMMDLMEVAKPKRIKTIVSHVEDANIMARMWQMGVNYIQGYHIQEPEVVMIS